MCTCGIHSIAITDLCTLLCASQKLTEFSGGGEGGRSPKAAGQLSSTSQLPPGNLTSLEKSTGVTGSYLLRRGNRLCGCLLCPHSVMLQSKRDKGKKTLKIQDAENIVPWVRDGGLKARAAALVLKLTWPKCGPCLGLGIRCVPPSAPP